MAQVLLLAASGLARETLESIRGTGDHEVTGILDDNISLHGTKVNGVPVLGGLELAAERTEQLLICAGKGSSRAAIIRRLGLDNERYATHVSAHAVLGSNVHVGTGSIILAGTVATSDIRIGHHVVLMPRVVLTHDDVLSDYSTLAAGAALAGSVHVGREAYLGTNSTVRENLNIGPGSVLGMAAALISDLPAGQTWAGNPARELNTFRSGSQPVQDSHTLSNASLKEATR
ncbi:NeuD/PglB/VioB family sugar acetyltransferase [Glutamicibacter sp. NPDC087344]|uniref:NeuD/PglB/VioB family sugar acetyltransferase n=1 Tax=Glutamicibacter sp. NPDC087344 TaxID=3363994 RepID=UPI0038053AA3